MIGLPMGLKRGLQKMLILVIGILVCVGVLIGIILPPSSGKLEQFVDANGAVIKGSVSEKDFVEINGAQQGMIIKGKDITKPIMLYLNGGPGIPDYFLSKMYPTGLENEFVVCYWDYRGTALSYNSGSSLEEMTTQQFIDDTIAVTNYLKERFGQKKIYLLGHSFGTYIGIQAVAKAPELYHAYIAMSQMTNQPESEKLAYANMLAQYKAEENQKMVNKFEDYTIKEPEITWVQNWFTSSLRDNAMHDLGVGTMHNMKSVITDIFFPTLRCKDYSPTERINIWRGKAFSQNSIVFQERMSFNALNSVPSLEIPVYFLAGKHDLTCNYSLQLEYFEQLQAPTKEFYTFENSAHSPLYEEPGKALQIIMKDVLRR